MKKFFFLLLFGLTTSLSAQNVLSLYNMQHIPQVGYANPAFIPLGRINVSIPGVGSDYVQFGKSDFKVNGVNLDDQGTLSLNPSEFASGFNPRNSVFANANLDVMYIGFTVGKNYIALNATDRVSTEFGFPKEMIIFVSEFFDQLGASGTNPSDYREINDMQFQLSHVREYGFSWARRVNQKLKVGAKVKMLNGIATFRTNSSGLIIDADTSKNTLTGNVDVNIQTSGIDGYIHEDTRIQTLTGSGNYGFAADIGFEYRINSRFKVAASAVDLLGTIDWTDNVKNYVAEDVSVDFNTISWIDIITPGGGDGGLTGFYDSIVSNVDPSEVERSFQTHTPTKALASFTYYITPKIEATIVGQGVFYEDSFEPFVRVGIQGRVKRFLNYMVSYSIVDDKEDFRNLGVGLALNLGPIQIHALTDNIFDPYLFRSKFNPSLRFGVNLTIGRDYE